MRLLFLDFDGVLHPLTKIEKLHPNGWFCWLPILSELLAPWPDVLIVVHSSWREHFSDAELRQLLQDLGTRMLGSAQGHSKAVAIESVLRANVGNVKHHVVLDDDARLAATLGLNVIQCDPSEGLSSPSTQAALTRWLAATA